MRLKNVIVPGIDPSDILRSCFRFGLMAQASLITVLLLTSLFNNLFDSLRAPSWDSLDPIICVVCACLYVLILPIGLYAEHHGVQSIDDYIHSQGKILKRQLLGALARVYRQAYNLKTYLLLAGSTIAMTHVLLTNSSVGLIAFLIGQGLMLHNLPWSFKWQAWLLANTSIIRNLDESDLW